MEQKEKEMPAIMCRRCGVKMEPAETYFEYLGHGLHTKLPRCPKCGEVYIPEEMVMGKIADIERTLEDK